MIVFAVDTALDACSVAVVRAGATLAALSETMTRGQAERLAPMAQEAAAQAGVRFSELDRIAVTAGPGSFTGVRVGLSFARALALAVDRPCLGVSTLEALALGGGTAGLRAAVVETPGAAYAALYEDGAALLAPSPIEHGEHELILRRASGGRPFMCAGPGLLVDVAALAQRAGALDPSSYPPQPAYLRAPHITTPGNPR